MPRYAKPRSHRIDHWDGEHPSFGDDEPAQTQISVDDHEAIDTGLVWPNGEPVMRLPNPMGFGRDEDW